MNTNKMACWAENYSNEELESMFEEYKSQEQEKNEKYGKYRSEYEEELQRLRNSYAASLESAISEKNGDEIEIQELCAAYRVALEANELRLSKFFECKWEVEQTYGNFQDREAA